MDSNFFEKVVFEEGFFKMEKIEGSQISFKDIPLKDETNAFFLEDSELTGVNLEPLTDMIGFSVKDKFSRENDHNYFYLFEAVI